MTFCQQQKLFSLCMACKWSLSHVAAITKISILAHNSKTVSRMTMDPMSDPPFSWSRYPVMSFRSLLQYQKVSKLHIFAFFTMKELRYDFLSITKAGQL